MKRLLSKLCVECLLLLALTSTTASAQVWVNVNGNPNPFPTGSDITISVDAEWPLHCNSCWWPSVTGPLYAEITIDGSDGFHRYANSWVNGDTFGSWYFIDTIPGQTGQATNYYVSVTVYYYDYEMHWWDGVESGNGSASVQHQPTISGPDTVWWFNGENPAGYATSVVLVSDAGPSTQWTIVQGGNKVQLSAQYGESVTVTPTGIISSGYPGDIQITATAAGATSDRFTMTARRPYHLDPGPPDDRCSTDFGYTTLLPYTIVDNLLDALPTPVPINERWTSGFVNDYPGGNNWGPRTEGALTTVSFVDRIDGEFQWLSPQANCNQAAVPVRHWEQQWYVGSLTIGAGKGVQTDTLQQYLSIARHLDIRY